GAESRAEQLAQPLGVAHGEGLPVVVEVRPRIGAPTPDPRSPLLQLGLGVVAAAATPASVEADVGPIRAALVRLERPTWLVADHERDAVLSQQRVDVAREPTLV